MAGSDLTPRPFGLKEPLGALRPPDVLLIGYGTFAALVLAWGAAKGIGGCGTQLIINLAVIAGAWSLCWATRRATRPLTLILRLAYIPILYWIFYHQIQTIWPIYHGAPFDQGLADLELRLFGLQPSLAFQERFPSRWLGELFCFAYYAYYYYTPVVLLTVLLRRGYRAAEKVVFATSLCFYCCYAFFWAFPAVGPHFFFPPHQGPTLYPGFVFNHLLFGFTSGGEIQGGAFPSSHLAVAVLLTLFARREAPRLFWFLLPITVLICPAVVYLRAHYLIDVPTGIAVGVGFFFLWNPVWRRIDRWTSRFR